MMILLDEIHTNWQKLIPYKKYKKKYEIKFFYLRLCFQENKKSTWKIYSSILEFSKF